MLGAISKVGQLQNGRNLLHLIEHETPLLYVYLRSRPRSGNGTYLDLSAAVTCRVYNAIQGNERGQFGGRNLHVY